MKSNTPSTSIAVELPDVTLTRNQRKLLNKMAHQQAIHIYPMYEYKKGFKASQERYRVLYEKLMAIGVPFEEVEELIKEPKLEAAIRKMKGLQDMKITILAIPARYPFS